MASNLTEAEAAALAAAAPLDAAEAAAAEAAALDAALADQEGMALALADVDADAADAEAAGGSALARFDAGLRRLLAEAERSGWGGIAARMDAALAADPTLAAGPTLAECIDGAALDADGADYDAE